MEPKIYDRTELGKTNEAIVSLLRPSAVVLEIGCATGYMTRVLKERLRCTVTAVELSPVQAEKARPYADRMVVGDICDPARRADLGVDYDYVLYADVLEHLADPWEVVRWTRGLLREGGSVVASVPNVAHHRIRKQLLLGRFDYTSFGAMDDTHLRFFTERTFRALFLQNGYAIDALLRRFNAKTDRRLWRLCPNAFTYQFIIKASPAEGPDP